MLENLMNNPYAWAVLSLITVGSFLYAFIVQHKNKERKCFSYTQDSHSLIRDKKSKFDKLTILYNKQEIGSLCVSKLTIWNSGNRTINCNDMVTTKELTIMVNEGNKILDAEIIMVSENTNGFKIEIIDDNTAKILFEYTDPKDGVVVQVIHTGTGEALNIDCKIKGGQSLKNALNDSAPKFANQVMNSKLFFKVSVVVIGVMIVLAIIAAIICTISIFNVPLQQTLFLKDDSKILASQDSAIFTSISIWVYVLLFCIVYTPLVKRIYGVGVPKLLKSKSARYFD